MEVTLVHQGGMQFKSIMGKHEVILDAESPLGKDAGARPKHLLLAAVMGCTGMDVAALMKKHKIEYSSFKLTGNAEPRAEHPKKFVEIEIVYEIEAPAATEEQVKKINESVALSMNKYCAVTAMVAPAVPVFYSVRINGEIEARAKAEVGT